VREDVDRVLLLVGQVVRQRGAQDGKSVLVHDGLDDELAVHRQRVAIAEIQRHPIADRKVVIAEGVHGNAPVDRQGLP
jgi:hypothetical protein